MNFIVIGDIMLDKYYFCNTERNAPENSNIPIYNVVNTEFKLGGAANVAKNLNNLLDKEKDTIELISVVGNDYYGIQLVKLLKEKNIPKKIFVEENRNTTIKTRIFCKDQMINRYDIETNNDINVSTEELIYKYITKKKVDVIIISDYAKGLITETLCKNIIKYANKKGIYTFVDPKINNYFKYKNCFLFKPNFQEASIISKKKTLEEIFSVINNEINAKHTIITCGENGIYYNSIENHIKVPYDGNLLDVTGCGDIVLVIIAYTFLLYKNIHLSCYFANIIATKGISHIGNWDISNKEIDDIIIKYNSIYNNKKYQQNNSININMNMNMNMNNIINDNEIDKIIHIGNLSDVVFTNGCFDIIHSAHIKLLKHAKSLGKILVVGLNSDESVRRLKGDKRPINNENERCELLKNLDFVDYIIIFQDDTPKKILSYLKPKIIVKGGDYTKEQIIGAEYADQIVLFDYINNISTTNIIHTIQNTCK